MDIDWVALGEVFGVSLVVTVGLVGVFTLGIVGLSPKSSGGTDPASTAPAMSTAPTVLARAGAYVCFALCAAAVAYGIYLIVK